MSQKRQDFSSDKGFTDLTRSKDNGVLKLILRQGKGPRPTQFSEVEIHYVGYFRSGGKAYANSYRANKTSKFLLRGKKNQVIYGWQIACESMRKGEVARFKISSPYAYGANGLAPNIPPDTDLVFDIEMIDWKSMRSTKDKMMMKSHLTHQQLLEGAIAEKKAGNEMFSDGDYWDAVERYNEALEYSRFVYEPKLRNETRPVMLSCHLNKAMCHLKLKDFEKCIADVEEALKLDAHSAKGYYRRAVAYRQLGRITLAKRDIMQASRLDGKDPGISRELQLIQWTGAQLKKKEAAMFKHLFEDEETLERRKEETTEKPAVPNGQKKKKQQQQQAAHAPLFKEDRQRFAQDEKNAEDAELPGEEDVLEAPNWSFLEEQSSSVPQPVLMNPRWEFLEDRGEDDAMPELEEEDSADTEETCDPPVTLEQPQQPQWEFLKSEPKLKQTTTGEFAPDTQYRYDNSVVDLSNPKVYINISIDGQPEGKLIVELFAHLVPKTAAHFLKLCELSYGKTSFHRIIKDYMIMGGRDVRQPVTPIAEESVSVPLDREGLVVMATKGAGTNTVGSQFFITTVATPHLNDKYVVVGKVIEGIELILETLQYLQVDSKNSPLKKVTIRNCGQFDLF